MLPLGPGSDYRNLSADSTLCSRYIEGRSLQQAADATGYTRDALASLVRDLRAGKLAVFAPPGTPGRKSAPRKDAARAGLLGSHPQPAPGGDQVVLRHPGARPAPVGKRRLLRAPPGDLRLPQRGRGPGGGGAAAADRGAQSHRLPAQGGLVARYTVKERAQLEEMYHRGHCPWMIWDPERSGQSKESWPASGQAAAAQP